MLVCKQVQRSLLIDCDGILLFNVFMNSCSEGGGGGVWLVSFCPVSTHAYCEILIGAKASEWSLASKLIQINWADSPSGKKEGSACV